MELDFKNMKMKAGISEKDSFLLDVRESFANVIYRGCNGIAALELARKIFNSDGREDYSEAEIELIRNASALCTPQFIEAIENMIKENRK